MEYIDVSVIIPYYRSEKTIVRAINSVLEQTCLPKQIFIIDDFSNNLTDEELLIKLQKHKLITVIKSSENRGPGEARNLGIEKAYTKYVAFLDSDDIWDKNKLEIQYHFMEKHNIDISGHKSSLYTGTPLAVGRTSAQKVNKYKFLYKNTLPTRSVMLRKELPIRFQKNKRRNEDFLLWAKILFSNYEAYILDNVLAYSFKAPYGEGGLTNNMKLMHKEKLASIKTLKMNGYINNFFYFTALCFEKLKYKKRVFSNFLSNYNNS